MHISLPFMVNGLPDPEASFFSRFYGETDYWHLLKNRFSV
jgi:hypothetical protein